MSWAAEDEEAAADLVRERSTLARRLGITLPPGDQDLLDRVPVDTLRE